MSESTIYNLTAIFLAFGVIWFWYGNMRARETAITQVHAFCAKHHLQFLDGSVCLRAMTFSFTYRQFRRHYDFYYTRDNHDRRRGTVIILGSAVEHLLVNEDAAVM